MRQSVIIDPVTRISGFLEIQVELDQNVIVNARSSGLLFRGFETMLKGRPPLDAIYFTERICGICSAAHAVASTLALEDALEVKPDSNAVLVRNFIHGCEFIQNHLRQFYQFQLPDFVKGVGVPPAYDIAHSDFRLPEAQSKRLIESYAASVQFSRMAHQMLAVLGGKAPHNHGTFVGGVTTDIDTEKLLKVQSILQDIQAFVVNRTLEDVHILAEYYGDYYQNGSGWKNLMTYGLYDYPTTDMFYTAPKVKINDQIQPLNPDKITENIHYAWYQAQEQESSPLDPVQEDDLQKPEAYTFVKAPRYNGFPMEVGPLARMWLSGLYRKGISTMDRIIARVLELQKIIEIMTQILQRIEPAASTQKQYEIPQSALGKGLTDTTRGALGHWLSIKEKAIANYQIITPSTWNLSPEDVTGLKGVAEKALIGTVIQNPKEPAVEIGRIVRSFDPCVSCATHVTGGRQPSMTIKIL